jgi:hypothetical protein
VGPESALGTGATNKSGDVHWSFWVISAVALVWNAMGCINFFMQMDAEVLDSFSATARALVDDRPAWATVAFAVSQFGGALGCLLLLFRKSVAFHVFIASLLGVIATVANTLAMAASTIDLAPGEIVGYVLMPVAVSALLVWYAKRAMGKGWIR